MAMNPAWASEICPVFRITFSPSAIRALISIMSKRCSQKLLSKSVGARNAKPTASTRNAGVTQRPWRFGEAMSGLGPAQEPRGPPEQDRHDHQEPQHVGGEPAEERRENALGEPQHEPADEGAGHAAESPQDHHDEGLQERGLPPVHV